MTRRNPDSLERSTRYWPLVGIVLGLLQLLVYMFASVLLPHTIAVMLTITAGLLLTGGRHERGLARFIDGADRPGDRSPPAGPASGGWLGACGALGIAMLLLLRYETLTNLGSDWLAAALISAAAFARGCAVLATVNLPRVGPADGAMAPGAATAEPRVRHIRGSDALAAIGFGLAPVLLLTFWIRDAGPVALAIPLALLAAAALRGMMRRRLRGYSPEGLGAVMQVTEIAFLLGLLIALGVPVIDEAFDPGA